MNKKVKWTDPSDCDSCINMQMTGKFILDCVKCKENREHTGNMIDIEKRLFKKPLAIIISDNNEIVQIPINELVETEEVDNYGK